MCLILEGELTRCTRLGRRDSYLIDIVKAAHSKQAPGEMSVSISDLVVPFTSVLLHANRISASNVTKITTTLLLTNAVIAKLTFCALRGIIIYCFSSKNESFIKFQTGRSLFGAG